MKTNHAALFLPALFLILNASCSTKPVVVQNDPIISQTEGTPPSATAPSEEKVDQKALAEEFVKATEKKPVARKPARVKKAASISEGLKPLPPAPAPVAAPVAAPAEPVEASPEMGGFFSRHFAWVSLAAIAAFGFWFFLVFRRRREENNRQ